MSRNKSSGRRAATHSRTGKITGTPLIIRPLGLLIKLAITAVKYLWGRKSKHKRVQWEHVYRIEGPLSDGVTVIPVSYTHLTLPTKA